MLAKKNKVSNLSALLLWPSYIVAIEAFREGFVEGQQRSVSGYRKPSVALTGEKSNDLPSAIAPRKGADVLHFSQNDGPWPALENILDAG